MSIEAGITAALLKNAYDNVSSRTSHHSNQTTYNYEADYYRLKNSYTELQNQFDNFQQIVYKSFNQTEALMAFINAGRMALSLPILTLDDIQSAIQLDPTVNQLRNLIDTTGRDSKIGFMTRSRDYWENIKEKVFKPFEAIFKNGYDETGLYGKIDRGAFLNGTYGQISGYQIFYNNKQSIRILADEKIQLKNKVYDLTDEVERLNEENAKLRAQLAALQNT